LGGFAATQTRPKMRKPNRLIIESQGEEISKTLAKLKNKGI
jgi:hypothetical protein